MLTLNYTTKTFKPSPVTSVGKKTQNAKTSTLQKVEAVSMA